MNMELPKSERSNVLRHLAIVVVLLLLLVGPLFAPVPNFLGSRLGIESAVITLLAIFIIAFVIIIAGIFRLNGNTISWREQLRDLGLAQPSRLGANIAGILIGLAWGALLMTSILQFQPDTNLAELSLFRLAAALMAAFGAAMEDVVTRGFVMNRLHQINVPKWGQLVLSALLFAIYHTIWSFNIFAFIFSVVYGLILSALFLWGKRSLTPVILGHSLAVLIGEPFATMLIFLAPGA